MDVYMETCTYDCMDMHVQIHCIWFVDVTYTHMYNIYIHICGCMDADVLAWMCGHGCVDIDVWMQIWVI